MSPKLIDVSPWLCLHVYMAFSLCTLHVYVYIFPFSKDISHLGLEDHSASITWLHFNYLHPQWLYFHIKSHSEVQRVKISTDELVWGRGTWSDPQRALKSMMWSAEVSLPGHRAGCWSRERGRGVRTWRASGRFPLAQSQGAFWYLQAWKMRKNCKETEKKELMSWKKNQERDIQKVKKEFQGESAHCVECS